MKLIRWTQASQFRASLPIKKRLVAQPGGLTLGSVPHLVYSVLLRLLLFAEKISTLRGIRSVEEAYSIV